MSIIDRDTLAQAIFNFQRYAAGDLGAAGSCWQDDPKNFNPALREELLRLIPAQITLYDFLLMEEELRRLTTAAAVRH
jgi:hypothetical protein